MFKKIAELDQRIMGINHRNKGLIYPHNKRKHYRLADDKVLSKEILHQHQIPCAATYAVIENIGDIPKIWEHMSQYFKLAIKPANGRGGGGIKILQQKEKGGWYSSGKSWTTRQIYRHLANIIMGVYSLGKKDKVLIEYCIEPHAFFKKIYPIGVPDFRVILLKEQPLNAMLRVPTDQSDGKANLHQGGLGIGIDMEKGILTHGFDGKNYCDCHPDSKLPIRGLTIPYWKEILDISIQTAAAFPLQYLGVDIVIDQKLGPLIMEVNVRPGLGIQSVNRRGMREILYDL